MKPGCRAHDSGTERWTISSQQLVNGGGLSVPSPMNQDNVPLIHKAYFYSSEHNEAGTTLPVSAKDSVKRLGGWEDTSPLRWPVLADAPLSTLPPT